MRFEQLQYYDTAVRVGSLRRAAAELGVTQPTLTQQIQRLEEELNVVLLRRRSTGVVLTDAGRTLLPHVRQALQAQNGLYQEASAITGLHRGHLRLGAIPTATQMFLPEVVRSFQQEYPGVEFSVSEAGSGPIRDWVCSGEVDLGILAIWHEGDSTSAELRIEELFGGAYTICVPPGHRLEHAETLRVADLAGESFVVVQRGQILREVFERIASQVDVSIVYETNSSAAARRTVDAGVGISVQTALGNVATGQHRSVAIPLAESWAHASVALAVRRDEQPTPATRMFMDLVRAHIDRFTRSAR